MSRQVFDKGVNIEINEFKPNSLLFNTVLSTLVLSTLVFMLVKLPG